MEPKRLVDRMLLPAFAPVASIIGQGHCPTGFGHAITDELFHTSNVFHKVVAGDGVGGLFRKVESLAVYRCRQPCHQVLELNGDASIRKRDEQVESHSPLRSHLQSGSNVRIVRMYPPR